jgi:hypothetical protein
MPLENAFSVIVVEDEPDLQQTIRTMLERAGYVVVCAENADAALKLLRSALRPCILLWDPLTAPISLEALVESGVRGAPVATLPIGLSIGRAADGSPTAVTKRITSTSAVLSIVREHCPFHDKAAMAEVE